MQDPCQLGGAMHQGNILVVETEPDIRSSLRRTLIKYGYTVTLAETKKQACQHSLESFDLIVCEAQLPDGNGHTLIERCQYTPVLIIASRASMQSAVQAMKLGAADYIAKPLNYDSLTNSIKEIIGFRTTTDTDAGQIRSAIEQETKARTDHGIIGTSPPMQALLHRINKVAPTEASVLILGESGTGKELVAKALHAGSRRHGKPIISVNCAAIAESLIESELFGHEKGAFTGANSARSGLIEAADGGTLFLDEIGELPLDAQARLLRVLQEGEIRRVGAIESLRVDVRLVAATHRNIKQMVQEKTFREDLYYRLNVVELRVPALRERGDDVQLLAEALLDRTSRRMGTEALLIAPSALAAIHRHQWPGNVRELENAIERAVILCEDGMITADSLGIDEPTAYWQEAAMHTKKEQGCNTSSLSLEDYFQDFVLKHQKNMNETELAKKLGISRKCLWERRKRLGIPRKDTATS